MKIVLNENQLDVLKLPQFIYKPIRDKRTSLGDNPAFPPYGEYGFEYYLIKHKFEEINAAINEMVNSGIIESKESDYLLTKLSALVSKCKKIEGPLKPQLEKLCYNIVNEYFSIPDETIILKCYLTGKVKPKNSIRIIPEDGDEGSYSFEDIDEIEHTNKAVLKRRFINSLIQGMSYWLSTDLHEWRTEVDKLNTELFGIWEIIKNISDYLLFTNEEKIDKKNPFMMSYVEVKLGKNGKKTIINSQGIIFPYLLRDTIRGFLELFSSHGLPEDNRKAMYIIRKADFLVAEPWDLRFGMGLMDMLHNSLTEEYQTGLLTNTNRIPFFFTDLCSLPTDDFNDVIKNILLGTNKGKYIAKEIDANIVHNAEYQEFKDRISKKNIETSLISDDCFSKEELENYDVIEENEMDEMMAYHGSGADFDKFNHKKYLNSGFGSQAFGWGTYITDDKAIAGDYIRASKENPGKNFIVNTDILPYLKSLNKYDDETISEILRCFKLYVIYVFTDDMNPSFEKAESGLKDLINFKETELNCYLPLDKVIEMYNSSDYDYMSEEEKQIKIKKHEELLRRKEKPIIPLKACLDALYYIKPQLDEYIKNKKSYLYEVEIPDDNGFNFLSWYDKPTNEQQKAIKYGLINLEKRFNRNILTIYAFIDGVRVYRELSNTFERLVRGNGDKAASLFLIQCGFDGIKYPAGTIWQKPDGASEDAMNYVIFDANKVKIVNKTEA